MAPVQPWGDLGCVQCSVQSVCPEVCVNFVFSVSQAQQFLRTVFFFFPINVTGVFQRMYKCVPELAE